MTRMDNVYDGSDVVIAVPDPVYTPRPEDLNSPVHVEARRVWAEQDEARRRAEREECERNGPHEFEVLTMVGRPDPVAVVCDICGTEWILR
jgi:hypothetical protein